jgi:hypothetical protein
MEAELGANDEELPLAADVEPDAALGLGSDTDDGDHGEVR